eukprot:1161393-Pelagomonas_calceolata.AAC.8
MDCLCKGEEWDVAHKQPRGPGRPDSSPAHGLSGTWPRGLFKRLRSRAVPAYVVELPAQDPPSTAK